MRRAVERWVVVRRAVASTAPVGRATAMVVVALEAEAMVVRVMVEVVEAQEAVGAGEDGCQCNS